jgi:hypothetical protein
MIIHEASGAESTPEPLNIWTSKKIPQNWKILQRCGFATFDVDPDLKPVPTFYLMPSGSGSFLETKFRLT